MEPTQIGNVFVILTAGQVSTRINFLLEVIREKETPSPTVNKSYPARVA